MLFKNINAGTYIICNSSTPGSSNIDFAASVAYKIGYLPNRNYCLVALTDGAIFCELPKGDFINRLNGNRYGYRLLKKSELHKINEHLYR